DEPRAPLSRRVTLFPLGGRPVRGTSANLLRRVRERLERVTRTQGVGVRIWVHGKSIAKTCRVVLGCWSAVLGCWGAVLLGFRLGVAAVVAQTFRSAPWLSARLKACATKI